MNLEITPELILLGGAASTLVEILRALLLNLEAYPRIKALWPLLPSLLGALLVLVFPSAVPSASSCILKAGHGFFSSAIWAVAYPLIRNQINKKPLPIDLPASTAEGEKEKPS